MILGGFSQIAKATTDIKEAVEFANTLVMVCPSFAQEILFESMLPYLRDNQLLILMPGNYGGLVLDKMKHDSIYHNLKITFVDAISIPWACRISSPATITIMGIKEFLSVSILSDETDASEIKKTISETLPITIEFLPNPMVAGLENINFGGHPLLTTLNMGILENFDGKFNYYKDCCSTATANAAAKMDEERMSVGVAYELELRTELEAMNVLYNCEYKTVYEFNRASSTHEKINTSPTNSKSRYVTEDVPYLLVPCYELAKKANIKVPIVESCIHIASAYNKANYFESGRTLEKMGLGDLSLEEIIKKYSVISFK